MLADNIVGIYNSIQKEYPKHVDSNWFIGGEDYPEIKKNRRQIIQKEKIELYNENKLYDDVRQLFHLYHMDDENYGTEEWNPLGEIIEPGCKVVLKPNLVMDFNASKEGTDCLFTQPSFLAPVLEYTIIALKGKGMITIGDAPMQECNLDKLLDQSGYREMLSFFINSYSSEMLKIELVDFRELTTVVEKSGVLKQSIRKDARGIIVDLKNESEFAQYDEQHLRRMRITNYAPERLKSHHQPGKHEYYVSSYILNADVVINLPKPKTHRKAGYTAAMKNMVGINVRKEYLPHHTNGSVEEGGDEYKRKSYIRQVDDYFFDKKNTSEGNGYLNRAKFYRLIAVGLKVLTKFIYKDETEGSWYGNRTISKTIVDLNKILNYADSNGVLKPEKQRKVLSIGDMIITGEKEGPVAPSPKPLGVLVIGQNSFAFDVVVGVMMGADLDRIPLIRDSIFGNSKYSVLPQIMRGDKLNKNSTKDFIKNRIFVSSNNEAIDKKEILEIAREGKWLLVPTQGWKEVFD